MAGRSEDGGAAAKGLAVFGRSPRRQVRVARCRKARGGRERCGMPVRSVLHPSPPHGHSSRPPLQDRTTNRFLSYFFGGALLAQMRQMSCKGLSGVTELTDHVALVEPWKGVVRLHS